MQSESTSSEDYQRTERLIAVLYGMIGLPKPYVWWVDSPLMAELLYNILRRLCVQHGSQGKRFARILKYYCSLEISGIYKSVAERYLSNIEVFVENYCLRNRRAVIRPEGRVDVWESIISRLSKDFRGKIADTFTGNLEAYLGSCQNGRIREMLATELKITLIDAIQRDDTSSGRVFGPDNHFFRILYNDLREKMNVPVKSRFILRVGGLPALLHASFIHNQPRRGDLMRVNDLLDQSCLSWFAFESLCIAVRRPLHIHTIKLGEREVLHDDHGPAVLFADGYALWCLNGDLVPENVVTTPAHELDPRQAFHEANTAVQREIGRKVGIKRLLTVADVEMLDSSGSYELIRIKRLRMRIAPTYLKMINPSTGEYHIEGVPPEIISVQAALSWRAYGETHRQWNPTRLT